MPRKPKRGDSGAELRQYLLDEAIEFREFISHPTVRGPDGRPMRSPRQTWLWDGWSFSVDALANGESYRLRRHDCPIGASSGSPVT